MNAPVTRRALLGATAAVGAAALPAVALASPADLDAELYARLDRFDGARVAWEATEEPLNAALTRAVAAYPPRPDELRSGFRDHCFALGVVATGRERKPEGGFRTFFTFDDVVQLRAAPPVTQWAMVGDDHAEPPPREPDSRGEARRQEIIAAYDRWMQAREAIEVATGYTAAADAEDRAQLAWNAADDAVKAYQPRTLAGLARKAAWVADRLSIGNADDDLGEVFARQVAAFGGVPS